MAPKKMQNIGFWVGKRLIWGAVFAVGAFSLLAGVYAFRTLSNNPSASTTFTSNDAPMLTRSGGTYDRETMSMEALSDYVTAMTLISPVNGSQLPYNAGANATSAALSWGSVPKATDYIVYIGTSQGSLAAKPATTGTTLTVTGLTKNTSYYWQVVANMPGGRTKPSSIWVFTTNCPSTETLDGGSSCISQKTVGNCATPASVTNFAFYNGSATYAPNVTWNGSNWAALPTTQAAPKWSGVPASINTCEWKCATGYGWYVNNCIATPSTTPATTCTAPSSAAYWWSIWGGYRFANSSTSYTPQVSWSTSSDSWASTPATSASPTASPAANTCQWSVVCPGGYAYNATINKCERTAFSNTIKLWTDDAWGGSFGTLYSKCAANEYLTEYKVIWNWSLASSYAWNANYDQCLYAYSGNSAVWVVWQSPRTNYSNWAANYASYGTTTYTNTNTAIDGMSLTGGGGQSYSACGTWWYEATRAMWGWVNITSAATGWQYSCYYSNWWSTCNGYSSNDQYASCSNGYWASTQYSMKCALK